MESAYTYHCCAFVMTSGNSLRLCRKSLNSKHDYYCHIHDKTQKHGSLFSPTTTLETWLHVINGLYYNKFGFYHYNEHYMFKFLMHTFQDEFIDDMNVVHYLAIIKHRISRYNNYDERQFTRIYDKYIVYCGKCCRYRRKSHIPQYCITCLPKLKCQKCGIIPDIIPEKINNGDDVICNNCIKIYYGECGICYEYKKYTINMGCCLGKKTCFDCIVKISKCAYCRNPIVD